jgi:hypothetical protein
MGVLDLVRYREVRVADARSDQFDASAVAAANATSITQEDYQQFLLSQVKRIVHGDQAGNWYDDFEGLDIPSLQGSVYNLLLNNDPNGAGITYVPVYNGLQFATETWAFTSGGALIKKCTYTYNGLYAATAVCQVYDQTGLIVVAQTTTSYNWSSGRLTSTTLTRDV